MYAGLATEIRPLGGVARRPGGRISVDSTVALRSLHTDRPVVLTRAVGYLHDVHRGFPTP